MQEKEAKQAYNKRNVAIGGIVCLLLIMTSIGYYIWHKNTKTPQPIDGVTSAIAVVDVDKLMPEHVNYNNYYSYKQKNF